MRVLIIEDEPNLREALDEILESRGFSCDTVSDGKAGLHAAMSGLFDVVLLDLMLPKLDGFELLKKLRRNEITTPVIVSTALGDKESMRKALDAGANDYVTKPFNVDELTAKIRILTGEVMTDLYKLENLTLDSAKRVIAVGDRKSDLSEQETTILKKLINNETKVVPSEDFGLNMSEESLSAYVDMLKRKLQYLESDTDILHVRGVGYKLMMPDAPQIDWEKGF